MAQKKEYDLKCPRCGESQEVDLYESVNVKEEPGVKDQIMTNQLNKVFCASCEFHFRVDKPLLYNDPALGRMIYWIPALKANVEEGRNHIGEALTELNAAIPDDVHLPDVHLVASRTELVERIFLFEDGLDERIIEYIKYLIYTRNGDSLEPRAKALLFDAQDSTDEMLCFVVQDVETGTLEAMYHYNRSAYQGLCEMFDQDDQTARLMEMFPGPYVSARALLLSDLINEKNNPGSS